MANVGLILLGIATIGLFLVLAAQAFLLIFAYEVTKEQIIILLFHIVPIYTIPFSKIKAVREAPFHQIALVPGMHLFTHPFGRRVVIEMRDRWAKFAFLTPSNPAAFIADIKRGAGLS
jgi:hypothetical protein